ncbi:uroporphyrinogen-III C-methyltransferase [Benzoatithermus flavus]|uniref:uroporphyrinogen-III C-methyltransferase n=1 Tax=Benzoatithermus flavus TaxID=3108223 RepID=A0ABU8XXC1_9PROT
MPQPPREPMTSAAKPRPLGRATLIGAGPGDPELLTLKALKALQQADVILYDKLVNPAILELARGGARRIDVGKRCGRHPLSQTAINRLLLEHARAGAHVVRLKGGDPSLFARGGEEIAALRAAGVAVEIVPGISAAFAAAASLGVPLTHRGIARSLHLVAGHGQDDEGLPAHDWQALARSGGTLAVYMGTRTLPELAACLLEAGMAPGTPVVATENASLPDERRIEANLAGIVAAVTAAGLKGPTLILIGDVLSLVAVETILERDAA